MGGALKFLFYRGGAPAPPDEVGGQGVPFGDVPALPELLWPLPDLPWLLPEVEGEEPEVDDPVFGVEDPGVPAVPGKLPQGEPLGLVPGAFVVLGFTVEGCVLVPGVAGFVEFEPGTLDGEFGVALEVGGLTEPVGGVAAPVGGVTVPVGGVAVPGA